MEPIQEFFLNLFDISDWPARWNCGHWSDFHGWLYIISDIGIWSAYFTIPFLLMYFIKKRADVPFKSIIWMFVLFILFCGATHMIDAAIFYLPMYRFSALIRFLTAIISWVTVFTLFKYMPDILTLRTPKELERIVSARTLALEETTSTLQIRLSQLESFADITSHNLRSPLGNIMAINALYDLSKDEKEKDELIEKLKQVSSKMMRTVEDLSQVVLNTRPNELVFEEINLEKLTKDIAQTLTEDILTSNIKVITDFKDLPSLIYQKTYLESILLNLITNAIKYRDQQKSPYVKITGFFDQGIPTLTVEDNGLGINMQKFGDKVFKLHKSFHKNKDARGVGLFITKSQIESLGGTISVKSIEGQGTTFVIRFKHLKPNLNE